MDAHKHSTTSSPKRQPQFDVEQAKAFLAALLPFGLRGFWLEFRALHAGAKAPRQAFLTSLKQIAWEPIARANANGWSITLGPGLRKCKGGKKQDVGALAALWADLDAKRFGGSKERARAALVALPGALQPSAVIDSGHGIHVYWFLHELTGVTDENRTQLEGVLRWLHRRIGSDPVHDLNRVMRLPGSVNVKDPTAPVLCRLLSLSADRRFRLDDFTAHMDTDDATPSTSKDHPITFATMVPKLGLNALRVSARIKQLVTTGWQDAGRYKSRSEADLAVVTAMRKGGHTPDEIMAVFRNEKWGIGARSRQLVADRGVPEVERQLARCIAQADAFLQAERAKDGVEILFEPNAAPPDLTKVEEVVLRTFPELWPAVKAAMATVAAMLPDDVVNPPALIFEGESAAGKTTVIDMIDGTPFIAYRTDKFTPNSFVTHSANIKGNEIGDVDLLPRIRFRCMLTGELAPLFRGREDILVNNFSILTRVMDGRGLKTDSGARGRRGYEGDYLFAWLGATTPLPSRTWRVMQQLGARLLFYWVNLPVPDEAEIAASLAADAAYKDKVASCRAAANEFLLGLFRKFARKGAERPFGVTWNRSADKRALAFIGKLTGLAAQARAVVSVWKEDSGEINFEPPHVEQPYRLAILLYNLARGHALLHGRTQLSGDDLRLVTRVALDSMPVERRKFLRVLIAAAPGGSRDSEHVEKTLECSRPTAIRLMREMDLLKVARMLDERVGDGEYEFTRFLAKLRKPFQWLADPQVRITLGMHPDGDAAPVEEEATDGDE